MKTDRFADSIRRKLDSIRPEFSDRDWDKMQATLTKAGVTSTVPVQPAHPFAGVAAKLAVVGAIGTTVFLTTTIWQYNELKHLHQSLDQVTSKVEPVRASTDSSNTAVITSPANQKADTRVDQSETLSLEQSNSGTESLRNVQRDTVYITRYVRVPVSESGPQQREHTRSAGTQEEKAINPETKVAALESLRSGIASSASPRSERSATKMEEINDSPVRDKTISPLTDEPSTERIANRNQPVKNRIGQRSGSEADHARSNGTTNNESGSSNSGTNNGSLSSEATVEQPREGVATTNTDQSSQPEIVFESLASLPMQNKTVRWHDVLALRARQMRPARTVVVNSAPQKPAVSKPANPFIARVRVGAGGDISTEAMSFGGYSEILLGKRFSLSVGLSQARYSGTTFKGEKEFNERTREDFRKDFAKGLDPRFAIINIESNTTRVQVPINLGYRIPLTPTLSLLPSVGTSLNLQAKEYLSFIQVASMYPYIITKLINAEITRPVDVFTNLNISTGIEWHQKHWAAQASPVVTLPIQTYPFCNENTAIGLRARLFYQF